MVGRREEGGLGQQRPQTAEASPVLTPVLEEPTETQGPPSLREPRASCETATAVAGEATPANPAAGPTAPAVRPLPRILPAGPLELPPRRPAPTRPPGWRRPAREGQLGPWRLRCPRQQLGRLPPAAHLLLLPCATVGERRHFIPSPFRAKCLLSGVPG